MRVKTPSIWSPKGNKCFVVQMKQYCPDEWLQRQDFLRKSTSGENHFPEARINWTHRRTCQCNSHVRPSVSRQVCPCSSSPPLHSPLYASVYVEGLVTCCLSLSLVKARNLLLFSIRARNLVSLSLAGVARAAGAGDEQQQPRRGAQVYHPDCGAPPLHPGDNSGANRWFIQSTPVPVPPPGGGICGGLT